MYTHPYSQYLAHHGILGQKWGIRRTPEQLAKSFENGMLGSHVYYKTANMPLEEYTRACDLWNRYRELNIPYKEKAHVYEEFDNNLTSEEKECSLVSDDIGNYHYTAINKGHNQYKIIDKFVNEQDGTLDAVLTEVIGPDWRDYDE